MIHNKHEAGPAASPIFQMSMKLKLPGAQESPSNGAACKPLHPTSGQLLTSCLPQTLLHPWHFPLGDWDDFVSVFTSPAHRAITS
eukprot:3745676-Amphidinium_carterae.1